MRAARLGPLAGTLIAFACGLAGVAPPARLAADPPRDAAPSPVRVAAEAVRAATEAGDPPALAALARQDEPDPWLVADELLARGLRAHAAAFARAGGLALAPLAAHVEAPRDELAVLAARGAVTAARELLRDGGPEACARALEALDAGRPGRADLVGARWWFARAEALRGLQRAAEGAAAFSESAAVAQRIGWTRRARESLAQALLLARDAGALEAARASGLAWLALEAQHGDALGRGTAELHLASVAIRAAAWEDFAGHEQRGLALLEQTGPVPLYAATVAQLGDQLLAHGQPARAAERYERAVAAWERATDRPQAAVALGNLAQALGRCGLPARAVAVAQRAVALSEELGDPYATAVARVQLAEALLGSALVDPARAAAEQALPSLAEAGDAPSQARAWVVVGMARNARLDGRGAWEAGVRAREHAAQAHAPRSAAMAHLVLGSAAYALGRTAETVEHLERAVTELEAVGLGEAAAGASNLLGLAYLRVGDAESAALQLDRAAAAAPAGSLLASLGLATRALARSMAGDASGAAALAQQALRDVPFYRRGQPRTMMQLLLAAAKGQGGDWSGGLAVLREALAGAEAGDPVLAAGGRVMEVTFLLRSGDLEGAAARADAALGVARELAAPILEAGALGALAEVRLRRDDDAAGALALCREALERVRLAPDALTDEQRAAGRAADTNFSTLAVRAALRLGRPEAVLEFLEHDRAVALLAGLGSRASVRPLLLSAELLAAEHAARERESRATTAWRRARGGDPAAREAARAELDASRHAVEQVLVRLEAQGRGGSALVNPRPASLERVQAALAADQALVVYGLLPDEAVALVVERSGARAVSLGPAAALESSVVEALEALPGPADAADRLLDLRRLLLDPLGLPGAARRLAVSPDGYLAFVPFPALAPERDVTLTPSATVLVMLAAEAPQRGQGVLAVGDPDAGADPFGPTLPAGRAPDRPIWRRLPAAREEARALGDVVLLDQEATEGRLVEALAGRPRWRALHLACHGLLDSQRGMRSALLLAPSVDHDGLWRAIDVLRAAVPADLVVLSACETARGRLVKGEGVLGLTRAFFHAGAPRVLCSLWKVDDRATLALMTRFYERWLGRAGSAPGAPEGGSGGLTAAAALREAQAHVRAQPGWEHPRYWAAWVLWGLPD